MSADEERVEGVVEGEGGSPTSPPPAAVEPSGGAPVEEGKAVGAVSPSAPESSPRIPAAAERPQGYWPKSAVDRVAKLTARLREYEARAGTSRPVDPSTGREFTPEQIDGMINERAMLVASQTNFNQRCNEVAGKGAGRFPDWQMRLNGLPQLVDQTDARSIQQYNLFLEAALETGDADGIIYRLGSDLNEAARVLGMTPVKMAMEVGRLGEGKGREPSRVPKPIRPVGSTSPTTATKPDDPERGHEMSMADWISARNKQASDRRIR